MAGGVNTKFDPERIAEVAETMLSYHGKLTSALEAISQSSNVLKQYWQGDAADAYQAKAVIYKKAGSESTELFLSLANRLQNISGIQRKVATAAAAEAEALPIDGVN